MPNDAPLGHCPRCLVRLGLTDPGTQVEDHGWVNQAFPDYEILERLGRGGMGVVFKARQRSLNRLVALKMINLNQADPDTLVHRCHVEAEAAASLNHPNIVAVYEIGERDGQPFFTMQFIQGASLDKHIHHSGFFLAPPAAKEDGTTHARQLMIARLIYKIAQAVDYAHQHGVLHRDLKPANILLDTAGEPYLTDFGLAKILNTDQDPPTLPGTILGTPSYMAPELAAGLSEGATTASDIYSLGSILYTMLTGQPPFRGRVLAELMRKIIQDQPPPPSTLHPGVDRDLETVCLKCLEKNPAQRYVSARALAEDLDRWLRGKPVLARPVGRLGKFVRWCRHEPVIAPLAASVFVLLVSTTLLAFWLFARERAAKLHAEEIGRQLEHAISDRLKELDETPGPPSIKIKAEERDLISPRASQYNPVETPPIRLVFGVHMDLGSTTAEDHFYSACAMMDYLETNAANPPLRFDLAIFKGHEESVKALVTEQVDLMAANPLVYVLARQSNTNMNLLALEHRIPWGTVLQGAIFSLARDITEIQEFHDKAFLFGSSSSALMYVIPQGLLYDAGLKLAHLSRWKASPLEFRSLGRNRFEGGAILQSQLEHVPCHIIQNYTCPTDPWIATSKLDPRIAQAILKSLLELRDPNVLGRVHPELIGFDETCPEVFDMLENHISKAALFRGEPPFPATNGSSLQVPSVSERLSSRKIIK